MCLVSILQCCYDKQFFTELKLATTGTDTPEQAIVGYCGRHLNTWTKPGTWVKKLWDA